VAQVSPARRQRSVLHPYSAHMRRPVPLVLVVAVLVATTACGGDDGAVSSDSIVIPAESRDGSPASEESPSATDPGSTAEPGTAGTTATTAATAAPGALVEVPAERDACLVGDWTVATETIGSLIALALLPVPDLTIARGGFMVMLADDGTVTGDADFTGAFTLGETPGEADVLWSASGAWGTSAGTVVLRLDEQEGGVTELRLDGVAQPGSELDTELPLAGGAYTCTPTRLEVTAAAGAATIPLVFER